MAIRDLFNLVPAAEKYGQPVPEGIDPAYAERIPDMDPNTLGLMNELRRGVPQFRKKKDAEYGARWASQREMADLLMAPVHQPGMPPKLPLGQFRGQLIGYNDDRPYITIASSRSGKTATVLLPQIYTYPHSMIVLDPKGELAPASAAHREQVLGQRVRVLDPLNVTGGKVPRHCYNVLDELDFRSPTIVDDAFNIAQSIIGHATHQEAFWNEGAQEVLCGIILGVLQAPPEHRNLVSVRRLLTSSHPGIRARLDEMEKKIKARTGGKGFKNSRERYEAMEMLLMEELSNDEELDGVIAGIGDSYGAMPDKMRGSMIGTARAATRFLDSAGMRELCSRHDPATAFRFGELRDRPTTVYLVLPAGNQMQAYSRWTRTVIERATESIVRQGPLPRGRPPIVFMMEEFPTLEHMRVMETAAAFLPGYGIKLHIVAQTLEQITRHYPKSWKTFFASAGMVQCFANGDDDTLDYISRWCGNYTFARSATEFSTKGEDQRVTMPLITANEIRDTFSREHFAQILMKPGSKPMAFSRLTFEEVEQLRQNVASTGRMTIEAPDPAQLQGPKARSRR